MIVDDFVGAAERRAYFLANATDADERAAKCKEMETRQTWEELAALWRFMATQVGKDFKL